MPMKKAVIPQKNPVNIGSATPGLTIISCGIVLPAGTDSWNITNDIPI